MVAKDVPPMLISSPVPATALVFVEHMAGAERNWEPHPAGFASSQFCESDTAGETGGN